MVLICIKFQQRQSDVSIGPFLVTLDFILVSLSELYLFLSRKESLPNNISGSGSNNLILKKFYLNCLFSKVQKQLFTTSKLFKIIQGHVDVECVSGLMNGLYT